MPVAHAVLSPVGPPLSCTATAVGKRLLCAGVWRSAFTIGSIGECSYILATLSQKALLIYPLLGSFVGTVIWVVTGTVPYRFLM